MKNSVWKALVRSRIEDLRHRAEVVQGLTGIPRMTVRGAERFAWRDGGGQSAVWYFTPDGRVLLLTFDHERALNMYAVGDYALQESLFDGVPENLVQLVRDHPANHESAHLTDEKTGDTILCAGGVFWYDGATWRIADGMLAHCDLRKLDPMVESGFDYCLHSCLLGRAFTPETVLEQRVADGMYGNDDEKAEGLLEIREAFGR